MRRPESVWLGKDGPLLDAMLDFYAPDSKRVVDVTCNARRIWIGSRYASEIRCYDIDPAVLPHVVASWDALPDQDGSIDVLVYDPPHMPDYGKSKKYGSQFGLHHVPSGNDISGLHPPFLKEAFRVLCEDGLIFAKIKDYVHNHRYRWNLELFNAAARFAGFTPCDLIIKRDPSCGMESGRWKRRLHVRNVHCYWVVLRKGDRCEPKHVL